jgi:peroxiredoxin
MNMRWTTFGVAMLSIGCLRAKDPEEPIGGDADADTDADTDTGTGGDCEPGACDGTDGFALGNRFPGFEFPGCDGEAVTEAILPACGVTLFNVAAGWCQPCIEETPGFQDLYVAHQAEGFTVIQVLVQDENSQPAGPTLCADWASGFGGEFPEPLTFPVLIDPGQTLQTSFDIAQLPANVVVDRSGCVAGSWIGAPPAGEPAGTVEGLL